MKNLSEKFFSKDERDRINLAVQNAEKVTCGEIVPMVVSSSYHYPVSNILGGLILGLITALCASLIIKNEYMWMFLTFFIISFVIMHEIVKRILPLKRLFISDREIEEEVEEAAVTAFFRNELYNTRDRTGVLIFISIFEHKVWVLADKGINEKVGSGLWKSIVDKITAGIKNKNQADAVIEAISDVGSILKENFPCKADDKNELHNLIIGK